VARWLCNVDQLSFRLSMRPAHRITLTLCTHRTAVLFNKTWLRLDDDHICISLNIRIIISALIAKVPVFA
jgi:hypothetical protein